MSQSIDRHALIVAVSRYRDPKLSTLRAPGADAARLASVLADPDIGDFEVDVSEDEELPQLTRRIARFFSDRRPGDTLLLHFSCHGVKDDRGELYLAAADTELDLLSATGLSSSWLNDQIDRSRARRSVVLLDCCFSGSFPFGMRPRSGTDVNVRAHLEGRGRAILTASNSMEYSFEGDHRSGPLFIARSTYEPPVELDEQLQELIASPIAGIRLGAVEELATLLGSSAPGVVLAARAALERMVEDDSRRVSIRAEKVLDEADPAESPRPPLAPPPPTQAQQAFFAAPDATWAAMLSPGETVVLTATARWTRGRCAKRPSCSPISDF